MQNKSYWVYILLCNNQNYYTGYTDDIEKRYRAHLKGTASKYTRSFKPLEIAQCWIVKGDKSLAMQLERHIKNYSKKEKMALILDPFMLSRSEGVVPADLGSIKGLFLK